LVNLYITASPYIICKGYRKCSPGAYIAGIGSGVNFMGSGGFLEGG